MAPARPRCRRCCTLLSSRFSHAMLYILRPTSEPERNNTVSFRNPTTTWSQMCSSDMLQCPLAKSEVCRPCLKRGTPCCHNISGGLPDEVPSPHKPTVSTLAAALRRWLTDRAASVDRLRLVPKHAVPAGKLAPVWGALRRRLRHLELHLERELSPTSEEVRVPAGWDRRLPSAQSRGCVQLPAFKAFWVSVGAWTVWRTAPTHSG